MPTSDLARAGASFIPSPTIATLLFSPWSLFTSFSLSSGITSDMAMSIPTCFLIASAVCLLSPVSMTTFTPIAFIASTACLLVAFIVSATAMIPSTFSLSATIRGVLPSLESLSTSDSELFRATLRVFISFKLPILILEPSTTALSP